MASSGNESKSKNLLEAQLQATLNVLLVYAWYTTASGALTFVNERHADYLGLPKDHPLRFGTDVGAEWDSHLPLLHPDDHAEMRRAWSHCLRTGCPGEVSFRARNAEGSYRWFLGRVDPLLASDGTLLYWIGVTLDIEERKRADEALRRSEFYLAEGQRLSQTGSFGWKVSSGEIFWSDETFRILRCDSATKPTVESVLSRVHPEDRKLVQQQIERVSRNGEAFDSEYRLQMTDGAVKHVRVTAHPSRDSSGNLEFVGVVTDVSEQRHAEAELREVVDTIPAMVWTALPDGSKFLR